MSSEVLSRVEITNLLKLVLGSCSELVLIWAEQVNQRMLS